MTEKRINRELIFLRTFAFSMAIAIFFLVNSAFKSNGNQKFSEIDVERINIVEKDGTVKMIITNVDRFPNGKIKINDVYTNEKRKKRSGMLFFNEEGLECGGFIYDGKKNADGHSSGLSFTHDQYDGDQIMQLLSEDYQKGNERFVGSSLTFNDRSKNESQRTKNFEQGTPRIMLGKSRGQRDGLFLFDAKGLPKAMFYVDKENKAKLDFYDDKGNITASFPENPAK